MAALTGIPRTIVIGLAVAAIVVILAWVFQRKLIYIPYPSTVPPSNTVLPGSREVVFTTEDGYTLGGWLVPGAGRTPRPAVLVFNGNAGNRAMRAELARELSLAGLTVLLFDYRGYGGNPGYPTQNGLLKDARAARSFLELLDDVDRERIIYFGESLGAGVAVLLAAERPPAALILRSPFTSLVDVGRKHYWYLPVGSLLRDRYPSIDLIGDIATPLLVLAGERDSIVPAEQSRALHDAAEEPKRFVLFPGADHNDYSMLAGALLVEEVLAFIEENLHWERAGKRGGNEYDR